MKRFSMIVMLLSMVLFVQGCVVVIGTDADEGVYFAEMDNAEGGVRHDGDRLSREVARAIAADDVLVAEDIRVSSEAGTVVLKGRVRGAQTLERALVTAQAVEGVDQVVSRMTVDAG